jgi:hypothetical protein
LNWANAEAKLFGIDVHVVADNNWKARFGTAQQERKQAKRLEEQLANKSKVPASAMMGLKDRIKMARWRFGTCVVEAMQCRMREMHVRRRMMEMSKLDEEDGDEEEEAEVVDLS